MNGGTAVTHAQPEGPELCLGVRLRSILRPHRHHHPTQIPIAFPSSENEKDNVEPLEIPIGERRWYVVGYIRTG